VLSDIPPLSDNRVLIDFRTADDAGVYRWDERTALVQTVDFFTPIVDDPYTYGQIAAANAMSDVYAMGGRPLTALAVAGFPKSGLDHDTIARIFRGGFDKLTEAGVALLGGHTVQDPEVKFGYAITGVVDPSRVLSNAGARAGDALVLTKPLGTGIITTAIKFGRAPAPAAESAVRWMTTLNRTAGEAIAELAGDPVHACTDITGFGLIGHASEMASGSGVTIEIDADRVPVMDSALELAAENRPGGAGTNREHFGAGVRVAAGVEPVRVAILYDPQTSGGLLVSLSAEAAEAFVARLGRAGVDAWVIGRVTPQAGALIDVRPFLAGPSNTMV
jgi:selenide,water dikinase